MPHKKYMARCIDLAKAGAGHVAPNPMVGAVLVHQDRIIGEGYHEQYGGPHAEVNCLQSVAEKDRSLITESTLYVSLEPCAHFGKTPPCTDLILQHGIKKVVVAVRDPFEQVNGRGIEKLRSAGVDVHVGVLEKEALALNRRFFYFHTKKRPYIVLKWAQSEDRFMGRNAERTAVSNDFSNRLVHQWRSEEQGILIGANTYQTDHPALTVRNWKGKNPVRILLANGLQNLNLSSWAQAESLVFNTETEGDCENLTCINMQPDYSIQDVLQNLYERKILSVLVEGGARTLQQFLHFGLWNEARVITNHSLLLKEGVAAPGIQGRQIRRQHLLQDTITYYDNPDVL